MEAHEATALDWAPWMNQRLYQHVEQHGDQQWDKLAQELMRPVGLLQLEWNVLLIEAGRKLRVDDTAQPPEWTAGELGLLRRVIDALKESPLSMRKKYKIVASWLPGRSENAVKHAWKCHLENKALLPDGFPETVSGTLMAWPGVQSRHMLTNQQVAQTLLPEEPQLKSNATGSKAAARSQTINRKRQREAGAVQADQEMQETAATAIMDWSMYSAQYVTYLVAGAAAAAGTSDDGWLPLGRYSSGLSSSSSSMASANTVQGLATVLPQIPTTVLTVPMGRQSSNCSNSGADGMDNNRLTGTAVPTAGKGFDSLVEQLSDSQHCQSVPQQQLQQTEAPPQRKRSRLSQSTAVQQCMQQGNAAAASGASCQTVPGHGLVAYNMLGHAGAHQAVLCQPWLLEPFQGISGCLDTNINNTAAVAEAAAGPRLLKPASWGNLGSTAAGQLTDDQLTAVCGWSSARYGDGQQLQAAAAASAGPAPACYVAADDQRWLPESAVAAPTSQQLQQISQSQQQDSLVLGAAGIGSSADAAAGSGGALAAAAACGNAAVQLPVYTTPGRFSLQQVQDDWQQAQPLACMGFEAGNDLPDCKQTAELSPCAAHPFQEETADMLCMAYKTWLQLEQGEQMAGLIPSNQGVTSADPDASTGDTTGLFELTELLGSNADSVEMVVDAEHRWPDGFLTSDIDSDLLSEKLSNFDDLFDTETELGLGQCLELGQDDLLM